MRQYPARENSLSPIIGDTTEIRIDKERSLEYLKDKFRPLMS